MIRFNRAIRHGLGITILSLSSLLVSSAQAAGSVDMQVTSIIKQAMEGYNLAMEANDPAGWTKYFSDNVTLTVLCQMNPARPNFPNTMRQNSRPSKRSMLLKIWSSVDTMPW